MKRFDKVLLPVLVIVIGTTMHFIHEIHGFNHFLGYIFPVNECVWEHMKMIVWPMILLSVFLCLRSRSIKPFGGPVLAAIIAIPVQIGLFYAYWPFTHKAILIADIILYVTVMYFATGFGIKWSADERIRRCWGLWLAIALILILGLGFLTYNPFDMFLFKV